MSAIEVGVPGNGERYTVLGLRQAECGMAGQDGIQHTGFEVSQSISQSVSQSVIPSQDACQLATTICELIIYLVSVQN